MINGTRNKCYIMSLTIFTVTFIYFFYYSIFSGRHNSTRFLSLSKMNTVPANLNPIDLE